MTAHAIDAGKLPDYEISSEAPLWWGQLLLCVIEGSMFAMLIGIYFYLRMSVDVWPPPGIKPFRQILPGVALVPLAISCIGSWWASEGAKRDKRGQMLAGLGLNITLGVLFLALRFIEWNTFNFTWASDVHGSIVWAILFLHTLDVIADLIMTAVLIAILVRGNYGSRHRLGVHVDSVVWYFLSAIWIPLYVTVYWGPHLVGTR